MSSPQVLLDPYPAAAPPDRAPARNLVWGERRGTACARPTRSAGPVQGEPLEADLDGIFPRVAVVLPRDQGRTHDPAPGEHGAVGRAPSGCGEPNG